MHPAPLHRALPRRLAMDRRRSLALVAAWLVYVGISLSAGRAAAQVEPSDTDNIAAPTVAEIVEVQLVEIEVGVKDEHGEPVFGLQEEDFELWIGGEQVDIDFFEAPAPPERGSSASGDDDEFAADADYQAESDQAFYVVYADLGLLEPGDLEPIRSRLAAFLTDHLPPGARTMLVVADGTLRVAAPMDVDRRRFKAELAALDGSDEGGQLALAYRNLTRDLRRARSSIEQEIRFTDPLTRAQRRDSEGEVGNAGVINSPDGETVNADGFLPPQRLARDIQRSLGDELHRYFGRVQELHQVTDQHLLHTANQLRQLTRMIAGLPGRKHLVYLGRRLPTAAPAELFKTWQEETVGLLRDTRSLASEDFEQRQAALDGLEIAEADIEPFRDGGRLIARAALDAASLGVTLHTIELSSKERRRRFQEGQGKAGDQELDPLNLRREAAELATLDALGALALLSGGETWRPGRAEDDSTGGFFTQLGRDLASRYVLGVALGGRGDLRPVEVRLKNPVAKQRLSYRRTLEVRSLDAQAADRALAALTANLTDNALEVELSALETEGQSTPEESARWPVRLRVPLAKLALVPDGHVHAGRLAIYTCAGSLETGTTPVRKAEVPIRIRNSELLTALGRHVEVDVDLDLPPEPATSEDSPAGSGRRIAVVVRDEYRPAFSVLTTDLPRDADSH